MGRFCTSYAFDGHAPEAARVAERITAITGLAVTVPEAPQEVKGELHDLHAKLAFTCALWETVTIRSYIPGAVRKWEEQFNQAHPSRIPSLIPLEGINEPEGTQAIYHEGSPLECSLAIATQFALEDLGGRTKHPSSNEARRQYGCPISEVELLEKHRRLRRRHRVLFPLAVAWHVVLIPLVLISTVLTFPFTLWRAWRLYRSMPRVR